MLVQFYKHKNHYTNSLFMKRRKIKNLTYQIFTWNFLTEKKTFYEYFREFKEAYDNLKKIFKFFHFWLAIIIYCS